MRCLGDAHAEAEAETALSAATLPEGLEDERQKIRREPHSVVLEVDLLHSC
jgi:hypothetical protein